MSRMPTRLGKLGAECGAYNRYELSGYPPGEPVVNWGDYIAPDHQERIGKVWEQYVAKSATHEAAEWQWKNGRWVST